MTLSDWMSLKKEIAEEFARASASFVRIGYLLRKAEESEGYKNDGYDTLTEWAQAELGITGTYVSRFKAINARYSVGGYSDRLQEQFVGFGSAKLGEMLALPDADMAMVTPQTKREDIRALKQFNREKPEAEGEDWIADMMHVQPDEIRKEIIRQHALGNLTGKKCAEILNPGGSRLVRTGKTVIAMKDDGLIVKTFGRNGGRRETGWQEVAEDLRSRIDAGMLETAPEMDPAEEQEKRQDPQQEKGAEEKKTEEKKTDHEGADPEEPAGEQDPKEPDTEETGETETGRETKEDSAEEAERTAHESQNKENAIAPAQSAPPSEGILPEPEDETPEPELTPEKKKRNAEYIDALAEARGLLGGLEEDFQNGEWEKMSVQIPKLTFAVHRLCALRDAMEGG